MANPQVEDGHTRIANEILEHLMKMHLSPNQWQVLLCIIRKTYGFHKKVDYIANFQIVEATGLGKTVVSRTLHSLTDMHLITRRGKFLSFQKDWERWKKLAEQSTKVSSSANQPTSEKLAILSTELAEQSTKVSSPRVTQKIKETIQKKDMEISNNTNGAKAIWDIALAELKLVVSKGNYKTWLEKTIGLNYMGIEFLIGVPNSFVAGYLESNQRSLIEKTLIGITHASLRVTFKIMSDVPMESSINLPIGAEVKNGRF